MGFADELAAERGKRDVRYAAALRLWEHPAAAHQAAVVAVMQRKAGIPVAPDAVAP